MRIHRSIENCVIYLYSTDEAARAGREEGGTGFIVSVRYDYDDPGAPIFHYAVTANHVIRENYAPVIRINTSGGSIDTIPLAINQWIPHPDGDDLAAAELGH